MAGKSKSSIKRPMNSFFFYRKSVKEKIIRELGVTKSHEISKAAAEMWANEPLEIRDFFKQQSIKAHLEHKQKYPDFEW